MPQQRLIAVIDIGKTNAKLVLIDGYSGEQVGVRSTPNTVQRNGIYPHADVERLWQFIIASLRELNQEKRIEGISITTHGATAALMAGTELAMPVLDYEFDGPEAANEAYERVRPAFAETLSPKLPVGLNLGAQIFWQSRAYPEDFAKVTAILTYPQYWAWRLTGVMASETTSLGCHTDLWSPDRSDFSSMVGKLGWTGLFPEVLRAATVLGAILPEVAKATGLAANVTVANGIHDSNASLVPHLGTHETPFSIVSSGTWTIAMTVGGDTSRLDPTRDSLANVDANGRPVPTARFMGGREFDMLVPDAIEPSSADIAKVITQNIQLMPGHVPGVGPFPKSVGRWTQGPEGLTAGERTAAVSLYLALVTRACLDLAGLGKSVIIEGPLARNKLFGEALAQLCGVPVSASGDATGTSLGAAMLLGARAAHKPGTPRAPLDVAGFEAYCQSWREAVETH